jgi:hypothetical protein
MKDSFSTIQTCFGSIQYATRLRSSLGPVSFRVKESSSEMRVICLMRELEGGAELTHKPLVVIPICVNQLQEVETVMLK